jgi:hypothetical protein
VWSVWSQLTDTAGTVTAVTASGRRITATKVYKVSTKGAPASVCPASPVLKSPGRRLTAELAKYAVELARIAEFRSQIISTKACVAEFRSL